MIGRPVGGGRPFEGGRAPCDVAAAPLAAGGLSALAAKGAARESAARNAKQAKARRENAARDRATLARAKSATTWLAPIAGWKGAIAVVVVAWASLMLGPYLRLGPGQPAMGPRGWGIIVAVISLVAGLWIASFSLRETGWKRELASLSALPFSVENYVNAVGEGLLEDLVVSIRLTAPTAMGSGRSSPGFTTSWTKCWSRSTASTRSAALRCRGSSGRAVRPGSCAQHTAHALRPHGGSGADMRVGYCIAKAGVGTKANEPRGR